MVIVWVVDEVEDWPGTWADVVVTHNRKLHIPLRVLVIEMAGTLACDYIIWVLYSYLR